MKHRIKQLRTKILRMKQKEFSAKTGIAQTQLTNYESRGVTPSFAVIEKIAKAFDINPAWIVGWSNDINNPNLVANIVEEVVIEKVVEKVVHIQPPPYWQCDKQGKLVQWKQTRRPYIGHLRGAGTRPIFPFGGDDTTSDTKQPKINKVGNIRKMGKSQSGDVVSVDSLAPTLCSTTTQKDPLKVLIAGQLPGKFEMPNRVYDPNGIAPTIRTMQGGNLEPKIIQDRELVEIKGIADKLKEMAMYEEFCREKGGNR